MAEIYADAVWDQFREICADISREQTIEAQFQN
jgi:hypothetical protein